MTFLGFRHRKVYVSVVARTDTGRARDYNEDRFLVADLSRRIPSLVPEVQEHVLGPKGTLLVVADGMGGAAAGEVASEMAVGTVYEHLSDHWLEDRQSTPGLFTTRLGEAVEAANRRIHEAAQRDGSLRGMGTTFTAAGILGDAVILAQVGDSRAYLIRDGVCSQLTRDQSLMRQLLDAGRITEAEAGRREGRNIILQALGPTPSVNVDLTHEKLRRGDTLLLCSDGLCGLVNPEEMAAIAARSRDLTVVCDDLVELANARGGPDNITVILARLDGSGLRRP